MTRKTIISINCNVTTIKPSSRVAVHAHVVDVRNLALFSTENCDVGNFVILNVTLQQCR